MTINSLLRQKKNKKVMMKKVPHGNIRHYGSVQIHVDTPTTPLNQKVIFIWKRKGMMWKLNYVEILHKNWTCMNSKWFFWQWRYPEVKFLCVHFLKMIIEAYGTLAVNARIQYLHTLLRDEALTARIKNICAFKFVSTERYHTLKIGVILVLG